jgi:hypothetical protein
VVAKAKLEEALRENLTIAKMATRFNRGATTIRYWLKKHGLKSNPRRSSRVWGLPEDKFKKLVAESTTYTEVLAHFGLENKGHNCRTLHRRIFESGADDSHIAMRKPGVGTRRSLKEILVKGSTYSRWHLKRRLLEEGLLKNECASCGGGPTWQGEPLSLPLDHINGDSTDHRRHNLRLLCPNCHSQTRTYGGKKRTT